jgi:hypothetical protein
MFARLKRREVWVLSKWKWRLLNNRGAILHDFLEHMYAPFSCKLLRRDLRQILTVFTWLWGRVRICAVLLQASVLRADNVVELLAELRAILINIKPAADRRDE